MDLNGAKRGLTGLGMLQYSEIMSYDEMVLHIDSEAKFAWHFRRFGLNDATVAFLGS